MNIVLTCGPAWEPIDGMRRMTNASTGRLGVDLSDALAAAGHRVTVFRGELATAPRPSKAVEVRVFGTNDDLARQLEEWSGRKGVDAVLHAAALCDFRVARASGPDGERLEARKLSTRQGRVTLELEPATKVLPRLREWFPRARIVGWKYELDGGRDGALGAAWRQMREAGTDACVVNGAAWGGGFGWCEPPAAVIPCADAAALGRALIAWLG